MSPGIDKPILIPMRASMSVPIAILCFVFLIAGCSEKQKEVVAVSNLDNLTVTPSMKGWELYSWPESNTWRFSFFIGTNRLKSLSEVTGSTGPEALIRVTGLDSAKMVLRRFPAGENIMLIGQGWLQNAWRAEYGNLQLPPQSVIDELKTLSSQRNLVLTVAN